MLLASLVCTGVHGALQERTYSTYGPYWRESIFYTVRPHYYFLKYINTIDIPEATSKG